MTGWGLLAQWFPTFHVCLILAALFLLIEEPSILGVLILIFILYGMSPLLFKIYSLKYPVKSGRWVLNKPLRNDWWMAHQMQVLYIAVPMLEGLLRLIPGVYSFWLRLWGSKVGKGVYWTPCVEILDRHLMSIGDHVVFGHQVQCISHLVTKRKNGDLLLMVRPTRIGQGVLIGALTRIGPGVEIPDNTFVPYHSEFRFRYV